MAAPAGRSGRRQRPSRGGRTGRRSRLQRSPRSTGLTFRGPEIYALSVCLLHPASEISRCPRMALDLASGAHSLCNLDYVSNQIRSWRLRSPPRPRRAGNRRNNIGAGFILLYPLMSAQIIMALTKLLEGLTLCTRPVRARSARSEATWTRLQPIAGPTGSSSCG